MIEDIASRHNIPIVINSKSIEGDGLALDTPITFKLKGGNLKSALRKMLDGIDLRYFIADEVLQITTPADNRLVDEMLLLIRRDRPAVQAGGEDLQVRLPVLNDPRHVDHWAMILAERLSQSAEQPSLLYFQLPTYANRGRFRRLVSFAPAITTTKADALAVLEEEAELKNPPKIGTVEEGARELIEAVRGQGWQLVTLRDLGNRVVLEMSVDGQGRFRFDRRTEDGLGETAVCDGETLRHLYRELGLGATRRMSRFHRADLVRLVPWLLSPVEDLALGADLRLIGPSDGRHRPPRIRPGQGRGGPTADLWSSAPCVCGGRTSGGTARGRNAFRQDDSACCLCGRWYGPMVQPRRQATRRVSDLGREDSLTRPSPGYRRSRSSANADSRT